MAEWGGVDWMRRGVLGGAMWRGVARCDMVRRDTAPCGAARRSTVHCNSLQLDAAPAPRNFAC